MFIVASVEQWKDDVRYGEFTWPQGIAGAIGMVQAFCGDGPEGFCPWSRPHDNSHRQYTYLRIRLTLSFSLRWLSSASYFSCCARRRAVKP